MGGFWLRQKAVIIQLMRRKFIDIRNSLLYEDLNQNLIFRYVEELYELAKELETRNEMIDGIENLLAYIKLHIEDFSRNDVQVARARMRLIKLLLPNVCPNCFYENKLNAANCERCNNDLTYRRSDWNKLFG